MTYRGTRLYAEEVTAVPTENGPVPSHVLMTPDAIEALHKLDRPQAESVARAIQGIGKSEGKPLVVLDDGKRYLVAVPDDESAPVVMYREARQDKKYLVTALVDRDAYQTYEMAESPSFLQSTTFKATLGAAAAAALGILLGSRMGKS
jgi:hypothetical protein